MSNVFVQIGKGVEVAAQDLVKFCDDLGLEAQAIVSPRAMIGLAVLAAAVAPTIPTVAGAVASEGLNIPLDLEAADDLILLWPDVMAYLKTLAIQPVKKP